MMSKYDGAALSTVFASIVTGIESEATVLKCISNVRDEVTQNPSSKLIDELHELESSISMLESNLGHFEEKIGDEENSLVETKRLLRMCKAQSNYIKGLESLLLSQSAQHLHENKFFVTSSEFESIPKTTRGRVTHEQVEAALQVITKFISEKSKIILGSKKKLTKAALAAREEYYSLQLPEHGKSMFLTETEIRTTKIFESGEATGKAILHTLRALKRLKVIRSGNETTYVLL